MVSEFSWRIRVYYEDTDTGGVVFYANYLKFFERARTEWLRSVGLSQQLLAEKDGIMFIVRNTGIDYHAPAKLDDELKLSVVVERLGTASVQFFQQAWLIQGKSEKLLATARIKIGCVSTASFRPEPIPEYVTEKLRTLPGLEK